MKLAITLFFSLSSIFSCGVAAPTANNAAPAATPASQTAAGEAGDATAVSTSQSGPRTVMDFFALLPDEYFTLEGCDRARDVGCKKARAEYLKTFTEVEDVKNGYFKGGCDGAQSCIEMAIFKKPDGTYLVGVATFAEMMNDFHFLEYSGGKWTDVSLVAVPDYNKKHWYELPRIGTTMKVFAKKIVEETADFEISEKGKLLYELAWRDGKFEKK